ncbi:Sterol 3-beta-glucosyltransferase [Dissophora globulifera]|uniref:sterol 3beta-glucosyltransferase n=1 Tax=Dissophora globulifera TaxID=979702 RepID=A0A9P6URK9_9FUNG|nr:Sterol 3-beta-glucosyltransferase [Dissophora globulifera]
MIFTEKSISPPTSGSALMQFFVAAFRSNDADLSTDDEKDDTMKRGNRGRTHRPGKTASGASLAVRTGNLHGDDSDDINDTNDDKTSDQQNRASPERPSNSSPIIKKRDRSLSISTVNIRGTDDVLSYGSALDKDRVSQKLQATFGYAKDEELVGEYACWLVRSVLLPGYMYLTTNHVCFYAKLPSSHDVVQMEGFFSKKSKRTKSFSRFWFVLKNDVLSYYADQTEVYYPINAINLEEALSAEPSLKNKLAFYVYTGSRTYKFKTDSELARSDWVKAIQKSIFHAKMDEDSVKISIPMASVLAVEMNSTSIANTIRMTIKESDDSEDDFFFAYFEDTRKTLAALKMQLHHYERSGMKGTASNLRFQNSTSPIAMPGKSLSEGPPQGPLATSLSEIQREPSEQPMASVVSWLNPLKLLHLSDASSTTTSIDENIPSSADLRGPTEAEREVAENSKSILGFSVSGTAAWIAEHAPEFLTTTSDDPQETFRKEFSLPHGESLVETYSAYLLRVLPLYGKIYLSNNYICFKSTVYTSSTRVVVPLADVERVEKSHGTRIYFHGLEIITKLEEEIFFEFSSSDTRSTVVNELMARITPEAQDRRKQHRAKLIQETPSAELDDPMESRVLDSLHFRDEGSVVGERMSMAFHPGFKPSRPMHITCLTIGSRGDVQPYIALCKRLMKDGHSCRIATHGEFREWIEGHGIEFGHVGGNPSELIELCVENGMFTVSFIREGLKKFRGWLNELMNTAWEACQNTDILIESPSAMAGIHIAEALDIPYFRAFPFPWTRTRAFPHPFAVSERNFGGGYNYMTHAIIEQVFWKGISGQINKWRRRQLSLPPTSLEKMEGHRAPSLYSWSPSILPAPMDWHSWIHVTGYWFLDNPDPDWTPPEELKEFLDADPENKPVYIGFGSMVVSDPERMTKTIIDAVVKSGVRAIISKGWSDKKSTDKDGSIVVEQNTRGKEILYPDSVYMLKSVPHDWLFPRLAGVVHHGGAGTTAAGLRAGVPTVIKPYFGDQYFWAQRVEETGVGVWCHDLTVKKLSAALKTITTDPKIIKKSQVIGERIRAEDGVGKAIQYFYHDLVIARQNQERNKKDREQSAAAVLTSKNGSSATLLEGEGESTRWETSQAAEHTMSIVSVAVGGKSEKLQGQETSNKNIETDAHSAGASKNEDGFSSSTSPNRFGSAPNLQQNTRFKTTKQEQQQGGKDKERWKKYKDAYRGLASVASAELLTKYLKSTATELGLDRAIDMINSPDKTAEDLAAELEAIQTPHPEPLRVELLKKQGVARMQGVQEEEEEEDEEDEEKGQIKKALNISGDHEDSNDDYESSSSYQDSDDVISGGTTHGRMKLDKGKAKARKVVGSITRRANMVKQGLRPSSIADRMRSSHPDAQL